MRWHPSPRVPRWLRSGPNVPRASARPRRSKKAEAERLAGEVKAADQESQHHLHLHHRFAESVTIFQVAIALAAIAALARRKAVWWVSLGVGAVGAVFLFLGFFPG